MSSDSKRAVGAVTQDVLRIWICSLSAVIGLLVCATPARARAAVAPDCFSGDLSVTCALSRVDEAKDVDKPAKPVFERRGWDWSCYEIQYIRGDNGGPDTVMVSVNGVRGGKPPSCGSRFADKGRNAMQERDLRQVGQELKTVLSKPLPHFAGNCSGKWSRSL